MMIAHLPEIPTKVIAVHLNYRSRAQERGRLPSVPSYFLKPPSSLAESGRPVVRPQGCSTLCYEGELAVIIGRTARSVGPDDALEHVGWYAAANDFGVYDLRWADRGSNVMAKGHDGFTPLGPRAVPASEFDPSGRDIRTLVNGEVVQHDNTSNMLFEVRQLIADLSRFMTLLPGDVILTGTPANSRPVQPGDVVEVEIDGIGGITTPVVEAPEPLASYGAMPKLTPAQRAAAIGEEGARVPAVASETLAALRTVSTATLTVQLRQHGLRNTFLAGLRPMRPDLRMVGYAHTLRYVALREDVLAADTAELNAQKRAVETIRPDEVLVIEARGETGAGTIGDILALRTLRRGAAGIVTDGAVRDSPAIAGLELPTYAKAEHAAVLGLLHYPLETDVPVTCGGVLVMPGDLVVGDGEGVVIVPVQLADEVARAAVEQEEREAWALERVDAGEDIRGVYPISEARRPDFIAWRERRAAAPTQESNTA